jgi:hypothetical protein
MLLITDYDDIQGINRAIIVFSFLVLIMGAFIIAILTLVKRRKSDVKESRYYLLGISLFAAIFGIGRLVLLYHDYFAPNELDDLLYRIGAGFSLAGFTILTFTIEKFIFTKTKKLISIFGLICILLLAFAPKEIGTPAFVGGNIIVTVPPFFIYIYIAKTSTGAVRKQALFIILGMIMLFVSLLGGALLYSFMILDRLWSQLFGIIFSLAGLVLLSYGFVKSPNAR